MTSRVLRHSAPRFEIPTAPRKLLPMAAAWCPGIGSADAAGAAAATAYVLSTPLQTSAKLDGASPSTVESPWQHLYNSRGSGSGSGGFGATRIAGRMYLGGHTDAMDQRELLRRGITRVLNLAAECPVVATSAQQQQAPASPKSSGVPTPLIETLHIPLTDHSDEDIASHFDEALGFVRGALSEGRGVLVHCRVGVSRSATIVLAFLMRYGPIGAVCPGTTPTGPDAAGPLSYDEAFHFVKQRRPLVSPNLGFILSLHALRTENNNSGNIITNSCGGRADDSKDVDFAAETMSVRILEGRIMRTMVEA